DGAGCGDLDRYRQPLVRRVRVGRDGQRRGGLGLTVGGEGRGGAGDEAEAADPLPPELGEVEVAGRGVYGDPVGGRRRAGGEDAERREADDVAPVGRDEAER